MADQPDKEEPREEAPPAEEPREEQKERDHDRESSRKNRDRDRDRDREHRHKDKSSKHRDRSRSRDRHRSSRRRSKSRSRDRSSRHRSRRSPSPTRDRKKSQFDSGPSAAALMLQQQQQQQQQFLAQQLLMQQMQQINRAQPNQGPATNKKQREVYIGNLTCGMVSAQILTELINGALGPLAPDAATNPPVVNVSMDNEGKFAFVELRTEDLATAALHLDKVELCGRTINVGRPKGYVDPALAQINPLLAQPTGFAGFGAAAAGSAGLSVLQKAQAMNPAMAAMPGLGALGAGYNPKMPNMPAPGSQMPNAFMGLFASGSPATNILYLENMVPAKDLLDAEERADIAEDVKEECTKCGEVIDVAVPKPPEDAIARGEAGKVYVRFKEQAGAIAAQRMLHNRTFSGNKVMAAYVPEDQFLLAQAGEWLPAPAAPAPAEGVVKMRGLPFTATKQDIVLFFAGCGCQEAGVSIVMGPDGRPAGEAYVTFEGPGADIRQALAKDRMMLGNRYVELFFSSKDEKDRRMMTGTIMI